MIISFDQTPEDFYRLSENALGKGEWVKALQYCEKALDGKRSAEYRLSLAEIFLKMGRYREAMDAALSAIAQGSDLKAEAFDVMAKATTATGKLYDSLFYVMGKAQMEGDDDTLDAMDEVMDDLMGSFSEPPKTKPNLFLVGKKEKKNLSREMDKAMFFFSSEQYEKAKEAALSIPADSDLFEDAQDLVLRAEARLGDVVSACETAKKQLERDPKNGFVNGIRCIRMELGEPGPDGRRRPVDIPGSEYVIDVDTVIMAIGTSPNPLIKNTTAGLDVNSHGGIIVNEDGLTSRKAVYAGGDAVTGAATVISAMGAGKVAAKAIDEYLMPAA